MTIAGSHALSSASALPPSASHGRRGDRLARQATQEQVDRPRRHQKTFLPMRPLGRTSSTTMKIT